MAKWLLRKPRIFLLDEPTRGVDVGAKAEIHKMIQNLARGGTACLLISSEIEEIFRAERPGAGAQTGDISRRRSTRPTSIKRSSCLIACRGKKE